MANVSGVLPDLSSAEWAAWKPLLDCFEDAWHCGQRPSIEEHLSRQPQLWQILHLVQVDLEYRLKHGEPARVEEYVARFPTLAQEPDAVLQLARAEYDFRQRQEAVAGAEYLQRFPALGNRSDWLVAEETDVSPRVTPIGTPHGPAAAPRPDFPTLPGYEILGELGRGGMGVVFRGRDAGLQRFLAIKVLLPKHAGNPDLHQRFLDEAQIMGQLQHPGVAPIHEIGKLLDGRPFFSMKQVKGQTLTALLRQRQGPTDDLPLLVGIFAQVCQTLAYAHSRRIIHRDLKPENVMVGAFGEVQVMDWGLAKVLPPTPPGPALSHSAASSPTFIGSGADFSIIHTARSDQPEGKETTAGTVMGTFAYMPPEQARGEVELIDERSDVFGLGAILCEILTGQPLYVGAELRQRAEVADLREVMGRLHLSGAETELIELTNRCLAADREQRPRHAGQVAEALARYQANVQQRLRDAEIARAAAQVKAAEERKRWRVSVALLGVGLAFVVVVSGAAVWYYEDQATQAEEKVQRTAEKARLDAEKARLEAERSGLLVEQKLKAAEQAVRQSYVNNEVEAALDEVARLYNVIYGRLADPVKTSVLLSNPKQQWKAPLDAAWKAWKHASSVAGSSKDGLDPALKNRLGEIARALEVANSHWAIADNLDKIRLELQVSLDGKLELWKAAPKYQEFFASKLGMDFARDESKLIAAKIADSPLRFVFVAALDSWALWAKNSPLLGRVLETAHLADPEPWRDEVRNPKTRFDPVRLEQVGAAINPALHSPHTICLLAMKLGGTKRVKLLQRALIDHPQDFFLHMFLAIVLEDPGKQVGHYQAALVIRPDSAIAYNDLSIALERVGDVDGAIAACRKAIDCDPKMAYAHTNLGIALQSKGDVDAAIVAYRKAIDCDPKDASAHYNFGNGLKRKGDLDGAIAAYRKAIDCDPKYANAHTNLGVALDAKGDVDGAIAAYRKAIDCDPNVAQAHNNLAAAFLAKGDVDGAIAAFRKAIDCDPKHVDAQINLGLALQAKGDVDGAIAAYRKAIDCDPKYRVAHYNLGTALRAKGDLDGAIAAFRTAIDCDPKIADAYINLGVALVGKGDLDGGIAACRKAIDCDPKYANSHYNLGIALAAKGDVNGAIAAFRRATDCAPNDTVAHYFLGTALTANQDLDGGIAAFRKAIDCDPKNAFAHANLGANLRRCGALKESVEALRLAANLIPNDPVIHQQLGISEHWWKLDNHLPDVLDGKAKPANPKQAIEYADLCTEPFKKHYALAFRLYTEAFAADAKLESANRYNAACAAVQMMAGKDVTVKIGIEEWTHLEKLARKWLKAELETIRDTIGSPKLELRNKAKVTLGHWKFDSGLAPVREQAYLQEIPAEERAAWQQFWVEVDEVLAKLSGKS